MKSNEKVLLHRGMDKVKQKKFEEAIEIFERVLAMNQKIPEVWNNRGVALYGLGRLEESVQSYDRCLAIDPEKSGCSEEQGLFAEKPKETG